jgi:hypothetical protein
MGTTALISIEEAAGILDISVDNVRSFMRRGILRPQFPKGKGWRKELLFHVEEVSALAEVREMKLTPDQIISFAVRGYVAARAVERRLDTLEQLMGAHVQRLPTDQESVVALYEKGVEALECTPSTKSEIIEWSNITIAMGEEFFEALDAFTDDDKAWHIFYQVVRNIVAEMPVDQIYQDPELDAAYKHFGVAYRHFERIAYFHVRCRFGVREANKVFENYPNDYHEEILSITKANRPQP